MVDLSLHELRMLAKALAGEDAAVRLKNKKHNMGNTRELAELIKLQNKLLDAIIKNSR